KQRERRELRDVYFLEVTAARRARFEARAGTGFECFLPEVVTTLAAVDALIFRGRPRRRAERTPKESLGGFDFRESRPRTARRTVASLPRRKRVDEGRG